VFGAAVADYIALVWLFVCWVGYTAFADRPNRDAPNLVEALHRYRVRWMERMLERELRTGDVNILAALIRSNALFASTTIFILAGLMTLLGGFGAAREAVSELSFAVQASRELWEVKVLVPLDGHARVHDVLDLVHPVLIHVLLEAVHGVSCFSGDVGE